ncbi:response regulator [Peredibacter starrii]|uniref:Response regulator n=1 Tax=Peredibacter starrii TaxID=28202 RepID=A0AAX4HUG9_9BACT|nr:response regulator [Peredibacter starrii]WPU66932.1 response regulator [Peredibacter starrii]
MFDPKTKVLVVDDMLTMRKIVTKILRELGFTDIVEAADGLEAWEKTKDGSVGLIISDWNMPNCTGLDFLKRVRADQKLGKTPFLLVTAEAEGHQVAEAIKSGVDQYVVKPFSKEGLKAKLELAYKKFQSKAA